MFVDKFRDFLKQSAVEEVVVGSTSYLKNFVNILQPENMGNLLSLYYDYCEPLTQAKLSAFLFEVLQSSKAKSLIEAYLDPKSKR